MDWLTDTKLAVFLTDTKIPVGKTAKALFDWLKDIGDPFFEALLSLIHI